MMPAAFLGKTPVAPDLEVHDSCGGAISIPTKQENMAITALALEQLDKAKKIVLSAFPELKDLVRQVIFGDTFEARIARLLAERAMNEDDHLLRMLLRTLEDQFLLWVPVVGDPACDQQIQITRRQRFSRNQLFPRRRIPSKRQVKTALGTVDVTFQASEGRRRFMLPVAIERLQLIFGLTPIEYQQEVIEARRFASFHLRVLAPDGFIVRDIGLEAPMSEAEAPSEPEMEAVQSEPGLTFQGLGSEMGHLHCSRDTNPSMLMSLTTFGLRDGLTTLWAGAVVFTALLLWAIHRLAPPDLMHSGSGQLESTVAVLLIGPALAAAWAIRADSDVLERTLLGARALLLASAILAVATALSLAGFQPFHWRPDQTIEVYASLGYGVAALIVVCWFVTLPLTWFFYRSVLTSAKRNLSAVILICLLGLAVVAHSGIPIRITGAVLLFAGLLLASVGAHPGRAGTTVDRGGGPMVAGIGALGMLFGAGFFLGFYENMLSAPAIRVAVLIYEAIVLAAALLQQFRTT
jgi:hypothetical protein